MSVQNSVMEVASLRLRLQMNNRLRLEVLAALSKVFREYGEAVSDELLASVVLAIPDELVGHNGGYGERGSSNAVGGSTPPSPPGTPPATPPSPVPPPVPDLPPPVPPPVPDLPPPIPPPVPGGD